MAKKKLLLKFPQNGVSKPYTYHLIKDYGLVVNIFKARVTPEETGELWVELEGSDEKIKKGLDYLVKERIEIIPLEKRIERNRETCTDCGACVSVCPHDAILVDRESWEVKFEKDKCMACELCVDACPVKAIRVNF